MFDKTIVQRGRTEYVPYEKTVTHNYAPTTEQVKHLEELQGKAWESVKKCLLAEVEGNRFRVLEVHRNISPNDFTDSIYAIFEINGESYDIKISEPESLITNPVEKVIATFAESMAEKITEEILIKAAKL